MFEWEGRIVDNKSIMVIKAALPYLDKPVGEHIDLEGLLRAVRGFCMERERRIIDMVLNFFMMRRMMSVMNMMNQMEQSEAGKAGASMDAMLDMLKSQMPKEQQDMFDMVSMMMSAMAESGAEEGGEDQSDGERGGDLQEHAPGKGSDHKGAGGEVGWEGYEENDAAYHGSDAEAAGAEPFFFPGGGINPFGNFDKGYEPGGEAEGGDDEAGREEQG